MLGDRTGAVGAMVCDGRRAGRGAVRGRLAGARPRALRDPPALGRADRDRASCAGARRHLRPDRPAGRPPARGRPDGGRSARARRHGAGPAPAPLLEVFFGEGSETWALYRIAPAAKHYHQAYLHGLLEHSLTVAQAVSAISATFPGIDRDVAVTGALLHDIGKLEAYTCDAPIDLTDAGRLQGEIPLGYYRVRRVIEDLPGFPEGPPRACCTSS